MFQASERCLPCSSPRQKNVSRDRQSHLLALPSRIRNPNPPPHDCAHGGLDDLELPGLGDGPDGQEDLQDGGHEGHVGHGRRPGDLQGHQLHSLLWLPLSPPPGKKSFVTAFAVRADLFYTKRYKVKKSNSSLFSCPGQLNR